MSNSTPHIASAKSPRKKPAYPLWLHTGSGQWAKKVRGKTYYFGTDKEAALKEFLRVKDDLQAGRTPRQAKPDAITLHSLCNCFMAEKLALQDSGEISPRTYADAHKSCRLLLDHLGKTAIVDQITTDDLMGLRRKLSATRNATSLGNQVNRIRGVFLFAFSHGLIDRPIRFGGFKKPALRVLRRQRALRGERVFEPGELHLLLDLASPQLRAMMFLAINTGAGNEDCARLHADHLDLQNGWLNFPRPKTGVARRCPLWPETIASLRALDTRKPARGAEHAELVFVTSCHKPWFREDGKASGAISHEFTKLLQKAAITRPGLSFYRIRHTFQTVSDELGDYLATAKIMGHVDHSISGHYRERFPDKRLARVTDHVRHWLFGDEGGTQ